MIKISRWILSIMLSALLTVMGLEKVSIGAAGAGNAEKGTKAPGQSTKSNLSGIPSVNQSANQNNSNNTMGSALASTASSALSMGAGQYVQKSITSCPKEAECATDVAMAALLFTMSAAASLQSQAHGKTARESAQVASLTKGGGRGGESSSDQGDGGGNDNPDGPPTGPTPDDPPKSGNQNTNSHLAEIADTINSGKVPGLSNADLKNGTIQMNDKTIKLSDVNSLESMMAAGFSPSVAKSAWDQAQKISDDIMKDYAGDINNKMGALTESLGYDESSGGSSDYSRDHSGKDIDVYQRKNGLGDNFKSLGPANVAGLQKKFNGEPIGVAADSIFNMMSRRYKVKTRENSFFDDRELNFKY